MFEVYFDGDCPLCKREIDLLKRLDRAQRIRFTDIANKGFDPVETGLSMDELMASIRGRMPDGTMVEGVEVFRQLYAAIGLGGAVAITRLPGVSGALDATYRLFAKNRLKLTGRCTNDVCGLEPA